MYRLIKTFRFEASHRLPNHDGKCKRLHGHSWVGKLVVEGEELQKAGAKVGMLVDYGDISSAIQPLVNDKLDHWHLNESLGLENPTSEAIAHYIFGRMKPKISGLVAVIIEETCTAAAEYRP